MFTITVTHRPASTFRSDAAPEALAEPTPFQGFRTRTGRRDASLYGSAPEVILHDLHRHATGPKSWVSRDAAQRNLERLTERGYVATITGTA